LPLFLHAVTSGCHPEAAKAWHDSVPLNCLKPNSSRTMPIEYTNRKGDRYFLCQGTTKTGKPKYYASKRISGVCVQSMPEGYEFYEEPGGGIVSVRKIRASRILPSERDNLVAWTRDLAGLKYFIVALEADSLVIYTPGSDPKAVLDDWSRALGPFGSKLAEKEAWIANREQYMPMLRFTLGDETDRLFSLERWCYRGSIDNWIPLDYLKPLENLAKKYLPHLNQDSFFDLI
jgi:hypothetical protein